MPRGGARGGGGGGGGRGAKRIFKGQRRHFTDEAQITSDMEKAEREQQWRKARGEVDDDRVQPGDLPPSGSESEETDSEDEAAKPKGVAHLIEIENPNRQNRAQLRKVTDEAATTKTELSRREREEIEKQQARENYQKQHLAGKTEEARADLARLAIIRKQREEASKKRDTDAEKAKEAVTKKKS
ncbi:28 kDa heat- and acid-stable phosphoprotein-like [Mizuhopecten yessoensis]|uniref:28 kDa heat-and acid-stable phosphoprotein n=1 Tax=Mizuhopecten yessoensis TaxID=6573 RepID=A0A210R4P4_MIZYE|nr:28 kDa heat- and acid-stable phosphoprotein-like [Mizuhopecten yessoensis]OWF55982.1 28 kDa heat- and acid-stable phosphoprotein [Mizuhopecten yessoensis]